MIIVIDFNDDDDSVITSKCDADVAEAKEDNDKKRINVPYVEPQLLIVPTKNA